MSSTAADYTPDQAGAHTYEPPGVARRIAREAAWSAKGWHHVSGTTDGQLLHRCEDGHEWREQPDGGVGPSWGYGLTSIHYPDWPQDRCPEPERGWSRYTDERNGEHGYKCPSCGEVHYCGGCGMGVRFDPWNTPEEACDPPPPVCGKPPVQTLRWSAHRRGKGIGGWVDLEPQPGEQLALDA